MNACAGKPENRAPDRPQVRAGPISSSRQEISAAESLASELRTPLSGRKNHQRRRGRIFPKKIEVDSTSKLSLTQRTRGTFELNQDPTSSSPHVRESYYDQPFQDGVNRPVGNCPFSFGFKYGRERGGTSLATTLPTGSAPEFPSLRQLQVFVLQQVLSQVHRWIQREILRFDWNPERRYWSSWKRHLHDAVVAPNAVLKKTARADREIARVVFVC